MSQRLLRRDSLIMVQFEHSIEQFKCLFVLYLADLLPGDSLFLHFVGDEAAVAVLEGDFFYGVGAEQADERDHV